MPRRAAGALCLWLAAARLQDLVLGLCVARVDELPKEGETVLVREQLEDLARPTRLRSPAIADGGTNIVPYGPLRMFLWLCPSTVLSARESREQRAESREHRPAGC